MSKQRIVIVHVIRRETAVDASPTRVSFELAERLRDEGFVWLEKRASGLRLRQRVLQERLDRVEEARAVVKKQLIECTAPKTAKTFVVAASEHTTRRLLDRALRRFETISAMREKLLRRLDRVEGWLRTLDEERRSVLRMYFRQISPPDAPKRSRSNVSAVTVPRAFVSAP
ncbi:hypothetical protein HY479_03000 [Candidatus Uhrbacteria bacterium]|nr:hypothetical protein [Candidatus Uhrbacteria bacterium]